MVMAGRRPRLAGWRAVNPAQPGRKGPEAGVRDSGRKGVHRGRSGGDAVRTVLPGVPKVPGILVSVAAP